MLCEDVLFYGTAINTDPYGDMTFLANIHHGAHTGFISDVSRIDADLIHSVFCGADRGGNGRGRLSAPLWMLPARG